MGIFRGGRGARRLDQVARRPALRQLQRAHAEMQAGNWPAAAADFALLAAMAEPQRPVVASQLWIECGRACLHDNHITEAEAAFERGLSQLVKVNRFARLAALGRRAVAELQSTGQPVAAAAIQAKLESWLEGYPVQAPPYPGPRPPSGGCLPAKCPQCGGTVIPDEVEALEDGRAQCAYCGSILERS
jgi:hypothetical protein